MPMLESLTIKNFGIIEQTSLEFTNGLNTLTGETGAGKSILIDALRFALGERYQSSYLRAGAESCTVEAVFSLKPSFLKTWPCWDDFKNEDNTIIIQRSVTADGRNKAKINGLTASINQLKELGDQLIDFHGPHDHQQLLAEQHHQQIIDALTNFDDLMDEYAVRYQGYQVTKGKLDSLRELAASRERDISLLSHQVKELEQVSLNDDDYAQLESDRVKLNNSEKLFAYITQALAVIDNDQASLESILDQTFKPLIHLSNIDEKASNLMQNLSVLQDNATALLSAMRDYADSLSFDQSLAQNINDRYDAYQDIKKKYGPTLDDAREFYNQAREKLALLSNFEQNEDELTQQLKTEESELGKLAKQISQKRKKTADQLKKTIEQELKELGFRSVAFEARIEKASLSPKGADKIVFFISTNTGESLKPLADIVSSGEAARLMLAIKRALMKVDPVPVLIFDEIDAQIGGRLGTVIGTKLKEISQHRQVILITHLPQIAAFADKHFKITKAVTKGRTSTVVDILDAESRIHELAHMMSGDKMTDVSVQHAKDMFNEARKAVK